MIASYKTIVLATAVGTMLCPAASSAAPFGRAAGRLLKKMTGQPVTNQQKVKVFRDKLQRVRRGTRGWKPALKELHQRGLRYDGHPSRNVRYHNSTVQGRARWQPMRLTSTNVMTPKEEAFFRIYQVASARRVKRATRHRAVAFIGTPIKQGAAAEATDAGKTRRWVNLRNGELHVYEAKVVLNDRGRHAMDLASQIRSGSASAEVRAAYREGLREGYSWSVKLKGKVSVSGLKKGASSDAGTAFIQLYKPRFDRVWDNGIDGLKAQLKRGDLSKRLAGNN